MQKTDEEITQLIRRKGLRCTKTKLRVITVLSESSRPQTIKQIADSAVCSHLVSIYRSIDTLLKADIIKVVSDSKGKPRYELSDVLNPHHHHIFCTSCSKVETIDDHAIEESIKDIATKAGYSLQGHQLELSGLCGLCARDKL